MINGSGTQAASSGTAAKVKSQGGGAERPETTADSTETRRVFVRITKGQEVVTLRVNTRLLSEQERIEKDNEMIRRQGRGF